MMTSTPARRPLALWARTQGFGAALGLWAALLPTAAQAQTPAAAAAPQVALRAELYKPLAAAQAALHAQQPEQALTLTEQALALPGLTAAERPYVWRLHAAAALRAQRWPLAIERLEALLTLPGQAANDRLAWQESLVHAAMQLKDWPRTVRVAQAYVQAGGTLASMRTAWLQGLSTQGLHTELVQAMEPLLARDTAQNHPTPEAELRMLANAQRQLKNDAGYGAALLRLLQLYPSQTYWAAAVPRLLNHPSAQPRHELEIYRLLQASGNLEDAAEYADMASLAIKAGLPSLALHVIGAGEKAGVWAQGSDAAAHKRIHAEALARAREDDAQWQQLVASAQTSAAWIAVGQAYASRQQWPAAAQAFARAQQMGGARRPDELQLQHGISLWFAGHRAQARAQWAAIDSPGMAAELAQLWALLARD